MRPNFHLVLAAAMMSIATIQSAPAQDDTTSVLARFRLVGGTVDVLRGPRVIHSLLRMCLVTTRMKKDSGLHIPCRPRKSPSHWRKGARMASRNNRNENCSTSARPTVT